MDSKRILVKEFKKENKEILKKEENKIKLRLKLISKLFINNIYIFFNSLCFFI